jgi:putative ABC transport system substrate-binding protein
MRRREFVAGLGGAVVLPFAARAQQGVLPIIGWLNGESPTGALREFVPAFLKGLAENGYVDGRNVAIEWRWAENHPDRLPALAADLVQRRVAVIVTPASTLAALAAKAATTTIPIVFQTGANPVELGLVATYNNPGGNLTGVAVFATEMAAKRLALLHELFPAASSVAMLVNPGNPYVQAETKDLQSAARLLGVRLIMLNGGTEHDIASAFKAISEQQIGALLIGSDIFFFAARNQIVSLAAEYGVPTMFFERGAVAAGGLLSYGPDIAAGFHQVGIYAGRILKGERPSDLPVVQPTKIEFVINLMTMRKLGIRLPEPLLATADEVIE